MSIDTKDSRPAGRLTRHVVVAIVVIAALALLANGLLGLWNWQSAVQGYVGTAARSDSLSWLWIALYLAAFAIGGIGTASLFEMRRRAEFREQLKDEYGDLIARVDALKTQLGEPARKPQST